MPYVVMVRCPNSDKAVSTGIRCDVEAFSTLPPADQFACTACGDDHHWSVEDAWLRATAFGGQDFSLAPNDVVASECK